jgi:hypothetical protein
MAGTPPTSFHPTKPRDAVPAHCSVWLSAGPQERTVEIGRMHYPELRAIFNRNRHGRKIILEYALRR